MIMAGIGLQHQVKTEKLAKKCCKIYYKAPMSPKTVVDMNDITDALFKVINWKKQIIK